MLSAEKNRESQPKPEIGQRLGENITSIVKIHPRQHDRAATRNPFQLNDRRTLWRNIKKSREIYLIITAGLLYFIIMKYFPLYFIQVAFRHYNIALPVRAAEWAGFAYFEQLFESRDFPLAVANTVIINCYLLVFSFPAPIILALLLNETKSVPFKRIIQTLAYLPHFISWVVIASIMKIFMSMQGGILNVLIGVFGMEPVNFLSRPDLFRGILVVSGIWKEVGWGSIIYLAAISTIDPQLYESARMDGAGRFRQMWSITLPCILYVVVVLFILKLGQILNVGFEQILVLYNDLLRDTGLVLQYFVWFRGLVGFRYSLAAAASLINTVIAFILVYTSDRVAKRLGHRGIL